MSDQRVCGGEEQSICQQLSYGLSVVAASLRCGKAVMTFTYNTTKRCSRLDRITSKSVSLSAFQLLFGIVNIKNNSHNLYQSMTNGHPRIGHGSTSYCPLIIADRSSVGPFPTHLSSHSKTVLCHTSEFSGFCTKWFSSGKFKNLAGTP